MSEQPFVTIPGSCHVEFYVHKKECGDTEPITFCLVAKSYKLYFHWHWLRFRLPKFIANWIAGFSDYIEEQLDDCHLVSPDNIMALDD